MRSTSNPASTFNSNSTSHLTSAIPSSTSTLPRRDAALATKGRRPLLKPDENACGDHLLRKRPSLTFTRTTTTTTVGRTRRPPSPLRTTSPAPTPSLPRQSQTHLTPHPIPQRAPLGIRDHNVTAQRPASNMRNLAAPRNTTRDSTVGRMPVDKPASSSSAASRQQPQMPTLAKGMSRAPLTPKVASRQTVTVATPLPRRTPRPESALSNGPTLATAAATTPNHASHRDDLSATPVSSFLASNVTPRSGSRQSRVDSANSTPTGTPNLSKSDSWDTRPGLGISAAGGDGDAPRRPAVTFSPPPADWRQEQQQTSADSKFFYASDAKSAQPPPLAKNPPTQQKTPTFFYANGDNLANKAAPAPTSYTPTLAPASDGFSNKFVYANGPPDLQSTKSSGPGSAASSVSRLSISRPGNGSQSPASMMQRPASPVKMPSFPPAKSSAASAVGGNRTAMSSAPQLAPSNVALRRMSVETPSRVGGHSRTGSLNNIEPPPGARIPSNASSDVSTPSVLATPAFTMASILQAAEDFTEQDEDSPDALASPTKSTHGNDPLNELVASARRERKVQDLEITNASLEAINRTLERQLRKQTAELRRYRRLSRSGRLSLNSLGSVRDRIPSDSTIGEVPLAMNNLDLSDLSEEESEQDEEDLEESDTDESESIGSPQLSPNAVAARDARHRKRDEKRLQLDLSKHQQLLVDSQKINQSLKRCLGLTEELIKDGKRALEYQVRVSEVEIGGRVLAPPDEEDDDSAGSEVPYEDDPSRADDDDTQRIRIEEDPGANLAVWSKDPQDRDSGIELPGDGG